MTARDFALYLLDNKSLPGWSGSLNWNGPVSEPRDPRDRALAEQITTGVVKNLLFLQYLIEHYSGRPLRKVDALLQKILAISLYQLRFLDRIPASAAVDQAVDQAKRFRNRGAAGFTNAVLRRATRERDVLLPSIEGDARTHARIVLSHPPGLFDRMVATLGQAEALNLCRHDNRTPPTIVRLFKGASAEQLTSPGVVILPHEQAGLFVVDGAKQAQFAEWANSGIAQVQDPTAASVIDFCDIQPGQRVMDRCCGLGTKTLQICERLGDRGEVVAVDPSVERCKALAHSAQRRSLSRLRIENVGMLRQIKDALSGAFDRILVDVPCSNSGVLARRPEARYAQDNKTLASLEKLQDQILDDTAPFVTADGLLVYSTCSIWPDENQKRVANFLRRHPDYRQAREHLTLPNGDAPTRYHDGGYVAVLKRSNSKSSSSRAKAGG